MRIALEHPAIVGGRAVDGGERHDLVRVNSDFVIPEVSAGEAPLAFTRDQFGSRTSMGQVRLFDGKLYGTFFYTGGPDALGKDSYAHRELIVGGGMDFDPVKSDIDAAAEEIRARTERPVNNRKRATTGRDRRHDVDESKKACLAAPELRNWKWLAPDVESQLARWRDKVGERMANFLMVDGKLYARCFEPCWGLVVENARATVKLASKGIYQREVHKVSYRHDGLEEMGRDADRTLSHFFSASDADGLSDMAGLLDWKLKKNQAVIDILDPSAVSDDFFDLETVRHARMMLACGRAFAHYLGLRVAGNPEFTSAATEFEATTDPLRAEIVAWQEHRADISGITEACEPLIDLLRRAPDFGGERYAPKADDALRRVEHFCLREQMSDISITGIAHRFG